MPKPDTVIALFVADVRQAHVRDELRATGGSVYYLSQRDVVEGSEEVTLIVRDKNTRLILSSERQVRNADYLVKYEEGRLMFQRGLGGDADGDGVRFLEFIQFRVAVRTAKREWVGGLGGASLSLSDLFTCRSSGLLI